MPYAVEPFRLEFIHFRLAMPFSIIRRDRLREQPRLFGELRDRLANEFQDIKGRSHVRLGIGKLLAGRGIFGPRIDLIRAKCRSRRRKQPIPCLSFADSRLLSRGQFNRTIAAPSSRLDKSIGSPTETCCGFTW